MIHQAVSTLCYIAIVASLLFMLFQLRPIKLDLSPSLLYQRIPFEFYLASTVFFVSTAGLAFLGGAISTASMLMIIAVLQVWMAANRQRKTFE